METLSGAGRAGEQSIGQTLVRPHWDATSAAQKRQRQLDRAASHLLPSSLPSSPI